MAISSAVAATVASTARNCAWRSRGMTWVDMGSGVRPSLLAHVLLDERVDVGVAAHGAGDRADGDDLAGALEAVERALPRERPAAELHAHRHRLGVDAVRAADAQGVALLERAALADLAEPADVGDEDVGRLHHLVAQRRVAQVRAGHAVVHPAARLRVICRETRVDVLGHVGEERDDVVVGDGLELVDARDLERGVRADVRGLLARDADLAELGLRLARENLDLLPDLELVLELPDAGHLGAGVARDHEVGLSVRRRVRPCLSGEVRSKRGVCGGASPPHTGLSPRRTRGSREQCHSPRVRGTRLAGVRSSRSIR